MCGNFDGNFASLAGGATSPLYGENPLFPGGLSVGGTGLEPVTSRV